MIREKYSIKMTAWENWREISEAKFSEWNTINHVDQSIDETVESIIYGTIS